MGRSFNFTATVTTETGRQEQVTDTATFDQPMVTRHEAEVGILNELNRQGRPASSIRVND